MMNNFDPELPTAEENENIKNQVNSLIDSLENNNSFQRVIADEWIQDENWRVNNGWKGLDYIHNNLSQAVRIIEFYWNDSENILQGIVYFGKQCESHRGFCHGGAMCAVMDDVIGHAAFLFGKGLWSGATVQVNTKLCKPVPIHSVLLVEGVIKQKIGRKTFVDVKLFNSDKIFAQGEGITVDLNNDNNNNDFNCDNTNNNMNSDL